MKITYLTVIYKNYILLEIQRKVFQKLFGTDYNLIIVDNTPESEHQEINSQSNETIVYRNSVNEFDGISHGSAIDLGLTYVESDIVCIFDSDFFLINPNIHNYILEKFENGYVAVGAEYNDGMATQHLVEKFPEKFDNIPCCFCSYYSTDLAKSISWIVSLDEVNFQTSFIEVGWRIRNHILENNLKTLHWKTDAKNGNDCVFKDENNDTMGIHIVAGSHRRIGMNFEQIYNTIRGFYNDF